MPRSSSPNYAAPALEKGLDILEALSASHVPLSLSSLSRVLGRSNAEIFRMLNLLETRRYILRDETGAYRLSLKLFQLANAQVILRQLLNAALPPMRTLSNRIGESCHLSVLERDELVVLAESASPRLVRLTVGVGTRADAVHTASGRMLLAGLPVERCEEIMSVSAGYRELSTKERKELRQKIAAAAADQFSMAESETVTGVLDAAVPVGNPNAGIHAALAISTLKPTDEKFDVRRLLPALQECARAINERLG